MAASREEVFERVKEVLTEQLGVDEGEITDDASSLMFSSGIWSWSVRTSLTFSYTSSRDAAMSPQFLSGV